MISSLIWQRSGNYLQNVLRGPSGHSVALLVDALHHKPGGRGVDFRSCHSNVSLTWHFRSHYGPGVDSASNRNGHQEYFLRCNGGRCVGLAMLPPLCADCLEIWESQPPGNFRACPGLWYFTHSENGFQNWTNLSLCYKLRRSAAQKRLHCTVYPIYENVNFDWIVHQTHNPLTPNDPYSGRTAPLTSKRCILYIYSTNICTEYFKHSIHSPFFLFKMQFVS